MYTFASSQQSKFSKKYLLFFIFCCFCRRITKRQKALALVLAELDDTTVKGTINGLVNTSSGRAIEGDVEIEEYVNAIKTALDDVEQISDKDKDSGVNS